MNFEEKEIDYMKCYISGIYKCIKYGDWFFAYFKPHKWVNWGRTCEKHSIKGSVQYKTLKQAKEACKRHLDTYGDNPVEINVIWI